MEFTLTLFLSINEIVYSQKKAKNVVDKREKTFCE